jgi:Transglycosylase-like domain
MQPRKKAALGLGLVAAGVAVTGIGAATNGDPDGSASAEFASARAVELPDAQRVSWLDRLGEYVELEAARQYAIAVYLKRVEWNAAAEFARALAEQSTSSGGGSSTLAAIRACESGGDYSAVSSSGTYRGAYQFDDATWQSVGGTGDPAAASPAEQDMRAQMLYDQAGSSPWPVCGS